MKHKDASQYKMFNKELDVIHTENLEPQLMQVYNTVLPLYYEIESKFPSSNSDFPPERYLPVMEGDGRNDRMRIEVKYQNKHWDLIFYEERSYSIERVKSYLDINELAFFLVARYAYSCAGLLLTDKGIESTLEERKELKIKIVNSINPKWGKRLADGEKLEMFYEGGD